MFATTTGQSLSLVMVGGTSRPSRRWTERVGAWLVARSRARLLPMRRALLEVLARGGGQGGELLLLESHAASPAAPILRLLTVPGASLDTVVSLGALADAEDVDELLAPASVDARVDLYAVGAVTYHLLVGAPVFAGKTAVETCAHHLHSQPVPPSQRAPRAVPAALDELVLRCLAKDPAHRPPSAGRVMAALEEMTPEVGRWSAADADAWWRERAPALTSHARAERSASSRSGPRTIAVDLRRANLRGNAGRPTAAGPRAAG